MSTATLAKACQPWADRAAELAAWAFERAVNRTDVWGGYIPVRHRKPDKQAGVTKPPIKKRGQLFLNESVLTKHFRCGSEGDVVGLHAISRENTSLWGGIDLDRHDDDSGEPTPEQIFEFALSIYAELLGIGFHPLLTDSNGKGGLHLRVFFREAVESGPLYRWLKQLARTHAEFGFAKAPETFPKQEGVDDRRRFGNWLRLPGRHHSRPHISRVWDGSTWLEGAEAIAFILAIKGDDAGLMPFIEPPPRPGAHETNGHHRAKYNGDAADVLNRASKYLDTVAPAISGQRGHDAAYRVACKLVLGFDLSPREAYPIYATWNQRCEPPWDEADLRHKLDDADRELCRRGYLLNAERRHARAVQERDDLQIRNWRLVEVKDEEAHEETADEGDGDKKKKRKPIYVPMPMTGVLETIRRATGDWPRRVGQWLFVHEAESEVSWLEKTAATFGYLQSKTGIVPWRKGTGYVSQEQVTAELARTATNYIAVERFPHWPAMEGHYYACKTPKPGDGSTLNALLDRFCPSTQIDHDLFRAMFVTPGWGGQGGCRPAFLVTSTAGRGAGKTKNASMVGHLWGGMIDFHQNEDLKTIKERLLSPDGLASRVAMLDNIKSLRFSWAELESLITIPTISGKRMYVGEGSRPNILTWLLTLNGASLSTDMAQRVVIIQIDKPKRSGRWEEETVEFILANRSALLADVAAFFAQTPHPPRKFSRWASWERDILSRLPEPEEAQKVILERQGTVDVEQEEADILREYFAGQLGDVGYDVEAVWVHIPSGVAGTWYNAALNERQKSGGACRILSQLCEEGRITWLAANPSRAHGRGFVWVGRESSADTATAYDLTDRLDRRKEHSTR